MDIETIVPLLDTAVARGCAVVNFSGGEPFLLGSDLADMVREVSVRGIIPRITTGAYWSGTLVGAKRRLKPLADAGLQQLVVSFSDGHNEFLPVENMLCAVEAARSLKLQVFVSVVMSGSTTNAQYVRSLFESAGVEIPYIFEVPLIPFGRAAENRLNLPTPLTPVDQLVGGCPSLTLNPAVYSDGNISGCAVVFGRESPAHQYGTVSEGAFGAVLDRMNRHPLALWIHHLGVVALKDLIEKNTEVRFGTHYVNICHLCGDILSNGQALEGLAKMGFAPPGYIGSQLSSEG